MLEVNLFRSCSVVRQCASSFRSENPLRLDLINHVQMRVSVQVRVWNVDGGLVSMKKIRGCAVRWYVDETT